MNMKQNMKQRVTADRAEPVNRTTLEMMRHAVSHAGRNYYCAPRHTQEWGAWSGLVVLGLAQFGNLINDGCDQYFHVTDAGIEYLRKVGADAMTTPIDTVVLRKLLASCDEAEEQCKMQREVDSEWGGELRRKLGVARGMLDSVADDLEEVDHGPEAAHWEQTVREIRQILCETADMSDERHATVDLTMTEGKDRAQ